MEYEKRDLSRGLLVSAFIVGAASLILLTLTLTLFLQEAAGRVPCLLGEVVLGIVAAMLAARVGRRRNGWLVALFALIGLAGPALLGLLYLFLYAAAGAASGGAWGRPLRLRGRVLHPDLRLGSDWTRGALPSPAGLDQPTRDALEALWLHDAQKEHASVPAFSRLSWLLAAVGAPPDLIAAVHGAAVEEIDHARRCFALAAGYGGRTHTAEPMPDLLDRAALALDGDALSAIAVESVKDGCLLEDFNADVAAACAAVCVEPVTRDVLERISREERSHAELSWRVVAFCVERGGARVRRAVAAVALDRVARPTAASMEKAALVAAADDAALRRHGRLGDDQWAALWTPRLAATAERLRAVLDERAAA
ncbi:MAG TPA: hypothetical protein VIA18_07525 [Polyangia bacterium]|nr:hypothetical protein [Polyangia bacterium]